jgi:lipopolysaccharide/colanic/teichoic acid biosynthesis glycosyltransferase
VGAQVTNPLPNLLTSEKTDNRVRHGLFAVDADAAVDLFPRSLFMKMLCLERNRAERSGRRLVLMLVESGSLLQDGNQTGATEQIQCALSRATRETDIKGWYRDGAVIGVIFTEIPLAATSVVKILSRKVKQALHAVLGLQAGEVDLAFHVFPDRPQGDDDEPGSPETFSAIYPDLAGQIESRRVPLLVKRCLDIAGSLLALLILSPLMVLIAAAIKLTSPGPVLFRQTRLGQSGEGFPFLKFRSMYAKSDHAIHEAYITRFISNQTESPAQGGSSQVFKLQADPRVTCVGRFLRRTSLDEVPQFFSVLLGHMSLVGPRPPLPYEFARYEIWHRRRLLAVKPGITGFWQVEGRSRVKFDEMVRMDIAYARTWSIWMDIKILLRTPRAVVSGSGAC